ncbi:MAG TPA: hypothetical protein VEC38_06995 [Candidatus Binataceae bacterium]|nr:hypothetical protein [Candidatus Binataceae bacterium]
MAVENALGFLRSLDSAAGVRPVVVIFGPHAFLREYVLGALVRRLCSQGLQYRSFQVGASGDFGAVLEEIRAPDLFAPKRVITCRVLRSRRDRASDAGDETDGEPSAGGAGEGAVAEVIEGYRGPGQLIFLYERDNAPARIRRAADKSATLVNCLRPFDNQLGQYVQVLARTAGVRLAPAAIDLLISRHDGDLGAIANSLAKAAILADESKALGPDALDSPGGARMPQLFEIADSIAGARAAAALAQVARSIALGRDPIEILSVEIVPVMRRMMVAAAMLARRRGAGEIASSLGVAPASNLASRAIDGARRFGAPRLENAYRRACEMDAGFKNGRIKEREQALYGLVIDLLGEGAAPAR